MNGQQKKAFELLGIFVGICEKWDIPYFLVCGSALGAVKYGGFIPWDDDIDVGLLRKDYQRFLEVAPRELPEWCFLQNFRTEKTFPHTYSKLRNSNTAFIERKVAHLPMNHGIYIDIFPLDGHPAGWLDRRVFAIRKKVNEWIKYAVMNGPKTKKAQIREWMIRLLGLDRKVDKAMARLEKLYCAYPPEDSELWCNYGNWQKELEYAPKWHYGSGTWATFEGLRVRIPENYDAYLTQKYGYWRGELPEESKYQPHKTVVVDTERSYQAYL